MRWRPAEEFARAESIDQGKPVSLARTVDIPRAITNLRFFATAVLHAESQSHDTDGSAINYTLRGPRGVAGCISPWNFPLHLLTWKIGPALATGNTVVAKPSELTPMTAGMFGEVCIEAGLPAGVLNIVTSGQLLLDPLYDTTAHILPRTVLLVLVLVIPGDHDRLSLDYWVFKRRNRWFQPPKPSPSRSADD